MSRCFPFPPPGYMIKLRFDLDTPKKDRKKKKNRKEDKNERKERREKELKQKDSTTSHASFGGAMKFKDNGKLVKGEDNENEQLERSGITEELVQPVSSPQEPYSSDSTQSSKRKRCTFLPNQDHGPAIQTRLPLRKHHEPEDGGRRVESLYKSLLHIQPIAYELLDSLDQDWLFSSVKIEAKHVSKKQKTDAFRCSKPLLPRAQFMPEVDVYALPYTVPY